MTATECLARLDRNGALTLDADGPYVRFGFPSRLEIRKGGDTYDVVHTDYGDGWTVPVPRRRTLDRTALVETLERFLEGDRPVRVVE